jgi:hypothetical protein
MKVSQVRFRRVVPCKRHFWIRGYVSTPRSLRLPTESPTLLPLVQSASNLLISQGPYADPRITHSIGTRGKDESWTNEENVTPFFISSPTARSRPVGFLRPNVLSALQSISETYTTSPWKMHFSPDKQTDRLWAVSFASWVNQGGLNLRSTHMKSLASTWRTSGLFTSVLHGMFLSRTNFIKATPADHRSGWSDEEFPVYYPDQESRAFSDSAVAFAIERAALPLFGFANYGCLLTGTFQFPYFSINLRDGCVITKRTANHKLLVKQKFGYPVALIRKRRKQPLPLRLVQSISN